MTPKQVIARASKLADWPIGDLRKAACSSDVPSDKNAFDELRGRTRGELIRIILEDELEDELGEGD